MIGSAVVLGIGLIVYYFRWSVEQAELKAGAALYRAQAELQAGGPDKEVDPQEFIKVAERFEGTRAAGRALLFAAETYYVQGDYKQAQSQFERFQDAFPDSEFAPTAALGIAACLDAQGRASEAMESYQSVITRYPESYQSLQAKMALALLQESSGQFAAALVLYDELSRPGAETAFSSRARKWREKLLEGHPELAPKESPPLEAQTSASPATTTPAEETAPAGEAASEDKAPADKGGDRPPAVGQKNPAVETTGEGGVSSVPEPEAAHEGAEPDR